MSKLKFETIEEATAFAETQVTELLAAKKSLEAKDKENELLKLEAKENARILNKAEVHFKEFEEENIAFKTATETANNALIAALAEVEILSTKVGLQEKHGATGLIVTIKKKSYQLNGNRFFANGKEMNAEQLSKNQKELERMVEIGSGSLTLLD